MPERGPCEVFLDRAVPSRSNKVVTAIRGGPPMRHRRFHRRQFLQSTGAAAVGLAAGQVTAAAPARDPKRNVILIISDTMRRDALGCYGGRWVQTPHLDTFAKRAVRCENAFLCSPRTGAQVA